MHGQRLPYVSSSKHLGNTLDSGVKNIDLQIKRGITVGKLNGVLQAIILPIQVPNVQVCISIAQISMAVNYGDLFCEDFFKLLTSWNIYVHKAWDLPRSTHRRFIAPLASSI